MAKQRKVNTLDLIQQMAQKNKVTADALENIKQERTSGTGISETKQHFEPKSVRNEAETTMAKDSKPLESDGGPKQEQRAFRQITVILNTEAFRDRKETFTLSLSTDCLRKYEKLATGISYKLDIKTLRNDLIRKVLENFINRKYEKLIEAIDTK